MKTNNCAPNLLDREFESYGPRLVLLTDITYIQRCGKVDLIPGSKSLAKLETSLLIEMGTERFLQEVLSPLRSHYDYIIIDTNRAASPLMTNAPYDQRPHGGGLLL